MKCHSKPIKKEILGEEKSSPMFLFITKLNRRIYWVGALLSIPLLPLPYLPSISHPILQGGNCENQ